MEAKKEKEFYADQLAGSGIPKTALRDSALVAQELKEKHASEMRIETVKNARLREEVTNLREENDDLKDENVRLRRMLGDYRDAVTKTGLSEEAIMDHGNMKDIKIGMENGYPKTQVLQVMMLECKKYGQDYREKKEFVR